MSEATARAASTQLPDVFRLDGRVALVTGGARGIGAAISRSFAAHGAVLAAGYSAHRERAEQFLDELKRAGADASIHEGNVGNTEQCERVIADVIAQHGRLDILVNNAGITQDRPVWKMSVEDWHKVLRVNLSGAFYLCKPALEHMIERGSGRIINISSKSGLHGLTMTLAREAAFALGKAGKLDENGIGLTVNEVAPGFISTEMLQTVPEKVLDRIRGQIPLRRLGYPDEVARVVHFLAADASSYITGQVWSVNGGMEM